MKKIFSGALVICASLCLASCVTTTTPITATSNPVGNKCGEASCTKVLYIFGGSSNVGINAAAKKGGITKISHVDYVKKNCLWGFVTKYKTVVYGE